MFYNIILEVLRDSGGILGGEQAVVKQRRFLPANRPVSEILLHTPGITGFNRVLHFRWGFKRGCGIIEVVPVRFEVGINLRMLLKLL